MLDNINKKIAQLEIDNATIMLKALYKEFFQLLKPSGLTVINQSLPNVTAEIQQQVINYAWKLALTDALKDVEPVSPPTVANSSNSDSSTLTSIPRFSSREEFLAFVDGKDDISSAGFIFDPDCLNNTFPERAEHSKLNHFGYSVSKNSTMSSDQRQALLEHLISSGEISKSYVVSLLEHLIKINGKKESNSAALAKWKSDLSYVKKL